MFGRSKKINKRVCFPAQLPQTSLMQKRWVTKKKTTNKTVAVLTLNNDDVFPSTAGLSGVMRLAGNTESDWHRPRNSECLSKCFQNSGLLIRAEANYCTLASVRWDVIGHRTKENSFPLGGVAVNQKGGLPLAARMGAGFRHFGSNSHRFLRTGSIHNGLFMYLRYDWWLSRKKEKKKPSAIGGKRATSLSDNARFWHQPRPLPCSFALYNSDWLP